MFCINPKYIFFQKPWRYCYWNHSVRYWWHPCSMQMPLKFPKLLILIQHPASHWMRIWDSGCRFHFLILEYRENSTCHLWAIWNATQCLAWVSLSSVIVRVVHAIIHGALPVTWSRQMGKEDAGTDATASVYATVFQWILLVSLIKPPWRDFVKMFSRLLRVS